MVDEITTDEKMTYQNHNYFQGRTRAFVQH